MPYYAWSCENCNKEVEVLRSIENRDTPPEEICKEGCTPKWKRLLSTFCKKRTMAWGKGKGYYNNQKS